MIRADKLAPTEPTAPPPRATAARWRRRRGQWPAGKCRLARGMEKRSYQRSVAPSSTCDERRRPVANSNRRRSVDAEVEAPTTSRACRQKMQKRPLLGVAVVGDAEAGSTAPDAGVAPARASPCSVLIWQGAIPLLCGHSVAGESLQALLAARWLRVRAGVACSGAAMVTCSARLGGRETDPVGCAFSRVVCPLRPLPT